MTPATEIVLSPWETWTDFEHECGLSRVWEGVHFHASVPAGQAIGKQIGKLAYDFVDAHIAGTA